MSHLSSCPDVMNITENTFLNNTIVIMISCILFPNRLFIEKLPRHRDYKTANIPEKKETMRVTCDFPVELKSHKA